MYVMAWSELARQPNVFCDTLRNERAHTSKCVHQNIRDSVSAWDVETWKEQHFQTIEKAR